MSLRLILIRRRFGGDAFLNTGDIRLGRSLRFAFKRWGHTGFESVQLASRMSFWIISHVLMATTKDAARFRL